MRMRREFNLPKDPTQLSTRQMEFVEKMATLDVNLEQAKISKKMASSDKANCIIWIACLSGATIVLVFLMWVICYYNIKAKASDIEAMELGYEMQPRAGTSYLYWTKTRDEKDTTKTTAPLAQ
jgi:hypothetical protein